jgi:hypothetical protein
MAGKAFSSHKFFKYIHIRVTITKMISHFIQIAYFSLRSLLSGWFCNFMERLLSDQDGNFLYLAQINWIDQGYTSLVFLKTF